MNQVALPLAHYRSRETYTPKYGDYFVWSGIITTWHGLVTNYNKDTDELSVVFSNVPFLLLTMDDYEQEKQTRKIKLSKVRSSVNGKFAASRVEEETTIWYI